MQRQASAQAKIRVRVVGVTSIESRIRRQKKIVDAIRRQLIFEALVLERLESRSVESERKAMVPQTISDILERALRRSIAAEIQTPAPAEDPRKQGD